MEWISMAVKPLTQEDAIEAIGFHPLWIDPDFNPNGTRVGFINGDDSFTCAKWCGYHDEYHTVTGDSEDHVLPTHYMLIPNTKDLK